MKKIFNFIVLAIAINSSFSLYAMDKNNFSIDQIMALKERHLTGKIKITKKDFEKAIKSINNPDLLIPLPKEIDKIKHELLRYCVAKAQGEQGLAFFFEGLRKQNLSSYWLKTFSENTGLSVPELQKRGLGLSLYERVQAIQNERVSTYFKGAWPDRKEYLDGHNTPPAAWMPKNKEATIAPGPGVLLQLSPTKETVESGEWISRVIPFFKETFNKAYLLYNNKYKDLFKDFVMEEQNFIDVAGFYNCFRMDQEIDHFTAEMSSLRYRNMSFILYLLRAYFDLGIEPKTNSPIFFLDAKLNKLGEKTELSKQERRLLGKYLEAAYRIQYEFRDGNNEKNANGQLNLGIMDSKGHAAPGGKPDFASARMRFSRVLNYSQAEPSTKAKAHLNLYKLDSRGLGLPQGAPDYQASIEHCNAVLGMRGIDESLKTDAIYYLAIAKSKGETPQEHAHARKLLQKILNAKTRKDIKEAEKIRAKAQLLLAEMDRAEKEREAKSTVTGSDAPKQAKKKKRKKSSANKEPHREVAESNAEKEKGREPEKKQETLSLLDESAPELSREQPKPAMVVKKILARPKVDEQPSVHARETQDEKIQAPKDERIPDELALIERDIEALGANILYDIKCAKTLLKKYNEIKSTKKKGDPDKNYDNEMIKQHMIKAQNGLILLQSNIDQHEKKSHLYGSDVLSQNFINLSRLINGDKMQLIQHRIADLNDYFRWAIAKRRKDNNEFIFSLGEKYVAKEFPLSTKSVTSTEIWNLGLDCLKKLGQKRKQEGLGPSKYSLKTAFLNSLDVSLQALTNKARELNTTKLLPAVNNEQLVVAVPQDIKSIFAALDCAHAELVGGRMLNVLLHHFKKQGFITLDNDFVLFNADKKKILTVPNERGVCFKQSKHDNKLFFNTFYGVTTEIYNTTIMEYKPDFTIFGLSIDKDGLVQDRYGRGIADLMQKLIKVAGVAEEEIKKDPIIMLRAIKYSLLGFYLDDTLQQAIRAWKPEEDANYEHFFVVFNKEHKRFGKQWLNVLDKYGLKKKIDKLYVGSRGI